MVTGTQCLEHIETGKHSECNAQMIKLNSSNHWELHGAIFAQILSDMSVKSVCAVANFEGHERCGDFDSLPFLFSHHSTFGRWPGTPAEGCCSISHAPGDVWGQHFSAFDGISVWRCTRTLNWWVKNFHAWRVIVSLDPSIPAGLGLVRSLPGVERGVSSDKTCAHWTPRGLDVTWSAWYPVGSNDVVLTSPPPPPHTPVRLGLVGSVVSLQCFLHLQQCSSGCLHWYNVWFTLAWEKYVRNRCSVHNAKCRKKVDKAF